MRRFTSYGPVDSRHHYYAPRKELIDSTYTQLVGETPDQSGHYITVWAPRQTGKTWIMQQILFRLQKESRFDVLKINLEHLAGEEDTALVLSTIAEEIGTELNKDFTGMNTMIRFQQMFGKSVLAKPLILILDEFDALSETAIYSIIRAFRNIYIKRLDEPRKTPEQKTYLLHGVALIGVRSVLGVEQEKGSPFNIQHSVHIPNLDYGEVKGIFNWYEKESGQDVHEEVIEKIFYETRGQPGLTCWLGELLTDTYNDNKKEPLTMSHFERTYLHAVSTRPNTNIINIISKAKKEPYNGTVLELFRTDKTSAFNFDDERLNFLYMHGVIDYEEIGEEEVVARFANPFLQKRLFNFFCKELFNEMGHRLVEPFDTLEDAVAKKTLHIPNILRRYREYLIKNSDWLFKDAPRRRTDMRLYEAVFHFNIYMYLFRLLKRRGAKVHPEFPTGNGQIDIVIVYEDKTYGIELKSYTGHDSYLEALVQAAGYGKRLGLAEVFLVLFIETIDDRNRKKYESVYIDKESGVNVKPVFVDYKGSE